ncbi:MAG: hypothetical protein ACQETG_08950 [Thermodesulfobacteriota bacterium]
MADINISDPAIAISCFAPLVDKPVLEEIDMVSLRIAIDRNVIYPVVLVEAPFFIATFKMAGFTHGGDFIDPLEKNFVIRWFCHKNIGHGIFFKAVDERLLGVKPVAGYNKGQFGMSVSDFSQYPFSCIDLAVLFCVAVAVLDGFREKGKYLPEAWLYNNTCKIW